MTCRAEVNGTWYHFDESAAALAESIGATMGEHKQVPMAEGRGSVVFGSNYCVAILDTSPTR